MNARAALSQQTLTRLGVNTAGERTLTENQTQILTYSLGPRFLRRYASWADSDIQIRTSGSIFIATDLGQENIGEPSDTTSHELTTSLRSGPKFAKFSWELSSVTSISSRSDDDQQSKRRTTDLAVEYALNRFIFLRSGLGDENVNEPDIADQNSGTTWSMGVRLTPGSRTQLRVNYRRRFNSMIWSMDGSYQLGSGSSLSFSFEEDIQTSQAFLNQSLQNQVVGEDGEFVEGTTGVAVDPNSQDLDFVDQTSRNQTLTIGAVIPLERGSISSRMQLQSREFSSEAGGSQNGTEEVISLNTSYNRPLNPRASMQVSASYSETLKTLTPGTGDKTMSASVSFNKQFARDWSGALQYDFRRQDPETGSITLENSASVSLQKTF